MVLAKSIAEQTSETSPFTSTMSAASAAISMEPIAMPTSAWANAGESLIPSPTIATTLPSACKLLTFSSLELGSASAITYSFGKPKFSATAAAVRELSPVTSQTSTFFFSRRYRIDGRLSSRMASDIPITAATTPSITASTAVFPFASILTNASCISSENSSSALSREYFRLPMEALNDLIVPETPFPVRATKSVGSTSGLSFE
mmetsp:Transcript_2/g.8  ORF Transcript_2/g.8 Transcript_2/m.8 type:complete len:204 (-) Transcript_2:1145-1756(-)